MERERARLLLALWVSMGAWLPCAACGGRRQAASSVAQVPPAEEPPWTKAATLTPDAGAGRPDNEKRPNDTSTDSEER